MNDLIERWAAGDPKAADQLYRKYFDRARRFALRLGARADEAEDVAQETMIAALKAVRSGTRPEYLTSWLFGIARHVASRKTRLTRRGTTVMTDAKERSARTMAMRREMGDLLDRLVRGLPPIYREVLDLRHREDLSRKEIADRLDVSLDVVHARCERAYAILRDTLEGHFSSVVTASPSAVSLSRIRELRPAFRDAVIARHLEDLSPSEAAAKLGIPVATLRARLESAYEMLQCGASRDFRTAREEHRRNVK